MYFFRRFHTPLARSYVLMLDLDGVNDELTGVATCLDLPIGWAACGANPRDTYYDLWALRTFDDWCPCDIFFDCPVDQQVIRQPNSF